MPFPIHCLNKTTWQHFGGELTLYFVDEDIAKYNLSLSNLLKGIKHVSDRVEI